LSASVRARPLLETSSREYHAQISPDGQWLAFVSDQTGRPEIYVQSFPEPGRRWQISTSGGEEPRWARNGKELFFRDRERMMAVPIETTPTFKSAQPELLFRSTYQDSGMVIDYDVFPDGRFLMIGATDSAPPYTNLHVVVNWIEELRRLAPPR